jgi:autonomous glycyl radical cofactor GrcA
VFFLLSVLSAVFSNNPVSHSISSLSWSGYAVTPQVAGSQLEVIAINASWIVPKVNGSAGNGYSSSWIGIGGQADKTLIQVGTEQNAVNGQETYNAWYELLPSYAVRLTNMTIQPQDTIVASITLVNSATNEWNIQISDAANGQVFNHNFIYDSSRSSGEWIMERPTVNNQISALSDFGDLTFNGCYANVNNVVAPISELSFSRIEMTNNQYVALASVSNLGADGASFTVTYERSN